MQPQEARLDIFVIEDDPDIAEFVVDLLRSEGYRVAARADGSNLDDLLAAPPRFFLLDLMLSGRSGADICRYLRADGRTQAVPIVFMTAAAPATIAERLRGCAYDGLLRKPFDIHELLAMAARYARGGTPHPLPQATSPEANAI